jgi:hypothetical protein
LRSCVAESEMAPVPAGLLEDTIAIQHDLSPRRIVTSQGGSFMPSHSARDGAAMPCPDGRRPVPGRLLVGTLPNRCRRSGFGSRARTRWRLPARQQDALPDDQYHGVAVGRRHLALRERF